MDALRPCWAGRTPSQVMVHGRKSGAPWAASADGAQDGFRTLNLRFAHWKPAASGILPCWYIAWATHPARRGQPGRATVARPERCEWRPRAAEAHCLQWPGQPGRRGAYGKIIRVELLHKLHDELKYDGLDALTAGIAKGLRRCARLCLWPRPLVHRGARPPATEFRGAAASAPAAQLRLAQSLPFFAPGTPRLHRS